MATACETCAALYFASVAPTATAMRSKAAQQRERLARAPRQALFIVPQADSQTFSNEPLPSETRMTAADLLVERLLELEALDADWDGSGAAEPVAAALKAAREFVRMLSPESIIPKATLLADGNAVLYLANRELYAELEFDGGRDYRYYIRRGAEECFDEVKLDAESLPSSLIEIGFTSDAVQAADAA